MKELIKETPFSYQSFTQSNLFSDRVIADRIVDPTVGRFPGFQKKNVLN